MLDLLLLIRFWLVVVRFVYGEYSIVLVGSGLVVLCKVISSVNVSLFFVELLVIIMCDGVMFCVSSV